MMIHITRTRLVGVLTVWWALFAVLLVTHTNTFQLLTLVGTSFLLIVPGALTLHLLAIRRIELWGRIGLTLGFSLLLLMAVGLLGNTVLPYAGVARPLDMVPAFLMVSVLYALLLALVSWRFKPITLWLPLYGFASTRRDLYYALTPFVFVLLAVGGALRLNNGAGNMLTMVTLFLMGAYLFVLIRSGDKVGRNVFPIALYGMSLALLLMTSLRGWYIAGHDIQRELFVFSLAKHAGLWSVVGYHDAYNACLSITLLPTLLSNLAGFSEVHLYKILYPALFAITPGIAYLISRNWVDRRTSLIAGIFFMAFPTFFLDMPFLARQEIAFVFYGLMLYILFKQRIPLKIRQAVFISMGIGVIFSHYSTTYTTLFVFALATLCMPLFRKLLRRYKNHSVLQKTALEIQEDAEMKAQQRITFTMVLVLVLIGGLWTTFITGTEGNLNRVVQETWNTVHSGGDENDRSIDVLRLIGFGQPVLTRDLKGYEEEVVASMRAEHPDYFFASSTYAEYPITTLESEKIPPTWLGERLGHLGTKAVGVFGQLVGKLLQLSIVIGLVYVVIFRKRVRIVDSEYYLLAVFSMVFIVLTMVLPVLSNEYGVFRALQQSMYVVAPFMGVGIAVILAGLAILTERVYQRVSRRTFTSVHAERYANTLVAICVVLFFWYSTTFVSQLTGGSPPAFHLNNYGSDYRQFLVSGAEVAGIHWLDEQSREYMARTGEPMLVIQADRHAQNKIRSVIQSGVSQDMHPATIQKATYVFAGPAVLNEGKATVTYDGRSILYTYPVAFLEEQKNLVYDNGSVHVYR
jgi:uncharacterized membrane protein